MDQSIRLVLAYETFITKSSLEDLQDAAVGILNLVGNILTVRLRINFMSKISLLLSHIIVFFYFRILATT